MANAGLKAGLVGAVGVIILVLIQLLPCLNCIAPILIFLWYIGVGVLAGFWLVPPRTAGDGAGAGAIAGLITALVGGVINMIVSTVQFSIFGGQAAVLNQIPPEAIMQFEQAGIDPGMFISTGGVLGVTAVCCGFGLVLAAILGAVGGAIFASARPE